LHDSIAVAARLIGKIIPECGREAPQTSFLVSNMAATPIFECAEEA
jgi:hypothetical protein